MLLTITYTSPPATDLGYLLHKHPARAQSFELAFGQAHVFYPEAGETRCTASLLLDIDPVALARGRGGPPGERFALRQYVNDRPYVASSFLSVAIAQVYGSALGGRCKDRPDLVDRTVSLEACVAVLPCRGGEPFLRELFEPLGYEVTARQHPLDSTFPDWGESAYSTVTVRNECTLQALLAHLYVLIPVLDNDKHCWVGDDEVDKLLRRGEGWLAGHPARRTITARYLKHQQALTRAAVVRLAEEDEPDPDAAEVAHGREEARVEERISLNEQRLGAVLSALRAGGARRVVDLGCREGRLLRALLDDPQFEEVVGVDASCRALAIARDRLRLDRMPPMKRARIRLMQGALTYRDERIAGYDAAAIVEVIEHLDPPRLAAFERVVFECARPRTVVITTPNAEYNVRFETLPAGKLRHRDHRFEWTRAEFQTWANAVAERHGYEARFLPVGPEDEMV